MPEIDVSDVILDPMFSQALVIHRRASTTGTNGRPTIVSTLISPAPYGVVLPQSDQPINRGPDQQNLPRLIEVHTPFLLQSICPGFKEDMITWQGADYYINKVYPFSQYGAGFIRAEASSIASADPAPSH